MSLIGPSGCGKSTLMLITAGLIPPTGGEIRVADKPLAGPLTDVGIVFQDHLLLDFRTALANVMLQPQIRGMPLAAKREEASGCSRSSASPTSRASATRTSSRAACASACRSRAR